MAYRTLVAAKVNLDVLEYEGLKYSIPEPQQRLQRLVDAIRSDAPAVRSGKANRWRFANVGRGHGGLVIGRLCKVSDRIIEQAPEAKEPIRVLASDAIISDSFFVFDPGSETVVFEDRSPDIEPVTFTKIFRRLCLTTDRDIFDMNVRIFPDKVQLRHEIEQFVKVVRADFEIVHANWFHTKALNDLDEALKDARARSGALRLENPRGLNLSSDLLEDGLQMVERGYGGVKLSGYDVRKKWRKVDSRQVLLKRRAGSVSLAQRIDRLVEFIGWVKEFLGLGD